MAYCGLEDSRTKIIDVISHLVELLDNYSWSLVSAAAEVLSALVKFGKQSRLCNMQLLNLD